MWAGNYERGKIRNSKFETNEEISKQRKFKISNLCFLFLNFEIVSIFVLRISDLL
jgi:hypothetical protein